MTRNRSELEYVDDPQMTFDEAKNNDPDAIRRVFPSIVRQAGMKVGRNAAEDVAQEALIGLITTMPRKIASDFIATRNSVIPLLRTIVDNKANDHLSATQAAKRDVRVTSSYDVEHGFDPVSTSDVEAEVLERVGVEEMVGHLSRKVRKTEHREALLLVEFAGVSSEEGAAIQDVPVGTFKSRVHHAKAKAKIGLNR